MTQEDLHQRHVSPEARAFGFTYDEDLYDRMSGERFAEILGDESTTIHEIVTSYNNYGEFLFVTTSRPDDQQRRVVTFYGLGFHEHRERWYTDEWHWYAANNLPRLDEQVVEKEHAIELIARRRAEIEAYVGTVDQSPHAKLFEMLADLTDEDGAYTELEDLGGLADWLFDE